MIRWISLVLIVRLSMMMMFDSVRAQPYIQFGTGSGGPPSSGDCFKDFQYLRERFSWEQLQFFCQQWRSYSEAVDTNFTVVNTFTENQLTYVRSLAIDLNATTNTNSMTVRKEYRTMSETERSIFHFVLRAMKQQKIDGISKYDLLVMLSHPVLAPGAHVGAAFLPWHREYLRTFERAMQKINAFAPLPYWDPTMDSRLPTPTDSILWEPDFLGNGDGTVISGPFAGWFLHPMKTTKDGNHKNASASESSLLTDTSEQPLLPLTRNLSGAGRLMTADDAEYITSRTEFRQFSACLDLRLEQTSRLVHEWIGGSMYDVYYAANDPVFFMFHAYIDYLWEEWRRNSTFDQRVNGYPLSHEACTKYHYAASPMSPFEPLVNADGLSDAYTRLYYTYQSAPKCTAINPTCLSPLLFCHRESERCVSKVRIGGDCSGVTEYDPCYQSTCVGGKCRAAAPTASTDGGEENDVGGGNGVAMISTTTTVRSANHVGSINTTTSHHAAAAIAITTTTNSVHGASSSTVHPPTSSSTRHPSTSTPAAASSTTTASMGNGIDAPRKTERDSNQQVPSWPRTNG